MRIIYDILIGENALPAATGAVEGNVIIDADAGRRVFVDKCMIFNEIKNSKSKRGN